MDERASDIVSTYFLSLLSFFRSLFFSTPPLHTPTLLSSPTPLHSIAVGQLYIHTMDHHMGDVNPNAHPLSASHISNPLIIIHVTLMLTAYGFLMPIGIMVCATLYPQALFLHSHIDY